MYEDFQIIQDTREQLGWSAYFQSPCVVRTLSTGDYSAVGYENVVGVERKAMDDLVSCLGVNRARFERELQRAQNFEYFAVVVEGTYAQLATGDYLSRLHTNSAIESVSAFEVRYRIPFLFAGSQRLAAAKCESLLKKFHREKQKAALTTEDEFPF
jgi:ERCC4-type nuclease